MKVFSTVRWNREELSETKSVKTQCVLDAHKEFRFKGGTAQLGKSHPLPYVHCVISTPFVCIGCIIFAGLRATVRGLNQTTVSLLFGLYLSHNLDNLNALLAI